MRVADIMVRQVVTVREGTSLEEIARLMLDHRIGSVPVVDSQGQLTGIITESDFTGEERGVPFSLFRAPQVLGRWLPADGVESVYRSARTMAAEEIMTSPVITTQEDESLTSVVERMIEHDLKHLPVVRDGAVVGIVSRHDLLRVMLRQGEAGRSAQRGRDGSRRRFSPRTSPR